MGAPPFAPFAEGWDAMLSSRYLYLTFRLGGFRAQTEIQTCHQQDVSADSIGIPQIPPALQHCSQEDFRHMKYQERTRYPAQARRQPQVQENY